MTGIGPVPVKVPRVRDRGANGDKITFTPSILPRYLRKAKSIEELLPWLYLKGVCVFHGYVAIESMNMWPRIPRACGHRFHGMWPPL